MNKIKQFIMIHKKAFLYSICGCVFIYMYHDTLNKIMLSILSMIINITLSPKLIDGVSGLIIKILENIVDSLLGLGITTALFSHSIIKHIINKKNNTSDDKK